MKKAAILLGFFLLASPTVAAIVFQLSPSNIPVSPGDSVSVDAMMSGLGTGGPPSVGSFDFTIVYDPILVTFTDVAFGPYLGAEGIEALTDVVPLPGSVNVVEVSLLLGADLHALQPSAFSLGQFHFMATNSGVAAFDVTSALIDDQDGRLLLGVKTPEPSAFCLGVAGLSLFVWRSRCWSWRNKSVRAVLA